MIFLGLISKSILILMFCIISVDWIIIHVMNAVLDVILGEAKALLAHEVTEMDCHREGIGIDTPWMTIVTTQEEGGMMTIITMVVVAVVMMMNVGRTCTTLQVAADDLVVAVMMTMMVTKMTLAVLVALVKSHEMTRHQRNESGHPILNPRVLLSSLMQDQECFMSHILTSSMVCSSSRGDEISVRLHIN